MPLYEYLCEKCGSKFELIEKFSAEPKTIHEGECGGNVHRLISAPALQFKGSGWYITDYAKSGSSSPPNKNGEGKSGEGKSGEGKAGEKKSGESKSSDSSKSSSDSSSTSSSSTPSTSSSSSSSSSDSGGSKT